MSEVVLEADSLRVVFTHRNDRYAHRVEVLDETTGRWTTALESVEGTDADVWPPSPPFQQLHVEQRPTGPIVFLVGMAGKSHWSAAVEAAPDRKSVVFDVAVRCQLSPARLGSEYARTTDKSCVALSAAANETEVAGGLRVERRNVESAAPATLAWKYRVAGRDS